MDSQKGVPHGWTISKVSSLGKLLRGVNYKKEEVINYFKDGYSPILRGNNIQDKLNFDDLVFVLNKNVKEFQRVKANDILFTMSSGSKHLVGKSAKVLKDFDGAFGAFCSVFRPNDNVDKNLIAYFFQSPYYKQLISEISKGTNINNLKREHILNLDFPLPPSGEQSLIVEKIEELFSELDKGVETLKTAQEQLKVYRQTVLKSAFEGKLTNEEIAKGKLLDGWNKVSLGTIIEKPTYGTSKKCDYSIEGKGVLRIPNIINGAVDPSDLKYAKFDTSEINAYSLKEGDLLVIRSNGSINIVGKSALITKKDESFLFAGYLIRLRPLTTLINPKYLSYMLSTRDLRLQIESMAKSTSGVNNINADELKRLKITICPLSDQTQIIQEIESRLSVCDKIEETIIASLLQADSLRRSILKQAFEGKMSYEALF